MGSLSVSLRIEEIPTDWYEVSLIIKKPMKILRTILNPITTQVFHDCEGVAFPKLVPATIPEIKYGRSLCLMERPGEMHS